MKNKLIKGLFGFGLILLMTTGVNAMNCGDHSPFEGGRGCSDLTTEEGNDKAEASVTVGNVSVPLYSADISWDSLVFDWSYDITTKTFKWVPAAICKQYEESEGVSFDGQLYIDDTCSTKYSAAQTGPVEQYYYAEERENVYIQIWDGSENGEIVPSMNFNSNDKYSYVNGTFSYVDRTKSVCTVIDSERMLSVAEEYNITLYGDSNCTNISTDANSVYEDNKYYSFVSPLKTITNGEIPSGARHRGLGTVNEYNFYENYLADEESLSQYPKDMYTIRFDLLNDSSKEWTEPTSNDTIGTITISIRANN